MQTKPRAYDEYRQKTNVRQSFLSYHYTVWKRVSVLLNVDKALLRRRVLELRQQGMSYRQIGAALGIHWTRVGQIVKESERCFDYSAALFETPNE